MAFVINDGDWYLTAQQTSSSDPMQACQFETEAEAQKAANFANHSIWQEYGITWTVKVI